MFTPRLAVLPRYMDPITSNVMRQLRQALQLQREVASSSTTVEFEVRVGNCKANQRRQRVAVLPIHTSTAAVLLDADRRLFTFQAGMGAALVEKLLDDMVATGMASPHTVISTSHDALVIHNLDAQRFHFHVHETSSSHGNSSDRDRAETLTEHLNEFSSLQHTKGSQPTAPSSASHGRASPNIRIQAPKVRTAAWEKRTIKSSAHLPGSHVVCPEWGYDLRFSLATEDVDRSVSAISLSTPLQVARLRRRISIPLEPYFCLEVSVERSSADVGKFEGLLSSTIAKGGVPTYPLPWAYFMPPEFHVEVEVALPRLLKDWKRYHGAAVVAQKPAAPLAGAAHASSSLSQPMDDPFLFQVAQDLLTLLQFVAARR